MAAAFFCEEIIIEILRRLPVKSLLRFRSVQKSWHHLIQSLHFINLYSHPQNHNSKYLLFHGFYPSRLSLRFDDRQCKEYCALRFSKDMPEYSDLCTYGTSNGLICLFSLKVHKIYLWNPVIEKYRIIPVSPIPYNDPIRVLEVGLGFGYLDKINDYKVIKIVKYLPRGERFQPGFACVAYVYSLSTNVWKPLSKDKFSGFSSIYLSNSVVLNGFAYWVVSRGLYMKFTLCFDMENEIFREIMLPQVSTNTEYTITLVQECGELLSLLDFNILTAVLDIWILEKDGDMNEVWTKKITLNLGEIVRRRWPDKFSERWWPIGFRSCSEIVLVNINECVFLSYDLEKDEATNMVDDSSDLGSLRVIYNVYKGFNYHTDGAQPLYLNLFEENLIFLGDG